MDVAKVPADLVRFVARAGERDRYLAALLAPRAVRADLIALAAFGAEVARIPAMVSEPMLGEIRLQWWRDALAPEAGDASGHPVADAMRAAIARHRLDPATVSGVIDAQAAGLDPAPHGDLAALERHLAAGEGGLIALAAQIVGADPRAEAAAGAIRSGAIAYGLVRALVEAPALAAQGRTMLPTDLMRAAGLADAAGGAPPRPGLILEPLLAAAGLHLGNTRKALASSAAVLGVALRPVALVEPHLRALQRGRQVWPREIVEISPLARVWRVWRSHATGRL